MATSADLQIVIDAIADGMRRELKRAEGDLRRFSKQADREMQQVDTAFSKLGAGIKNLIAGISVAAAASGLQTLASAALANADAIDKAAQRAGTTAESFQRLSYAAGQSGVSVGSLERALAYANRQMAEGKLAGENIEDALARVADQLAATSDGAERAQIVYEAFGRTGIDLIPMLTAGADGLQALTDRADELGLVLDGGLIKASAEFNDRLDDLKTVATTIIQSKVLEELVKHTGDLDALVTDPDFHFGLEVLASGIAAITERAVAAVRVVGNLAAALRDLAKLEVSSAVDRVLEAGSAYGGSTVDFLAPKAWSGSYGSGGWSGSAGSLADTSRDEGLKIELTRPAGVTPAAPKVRSGGGGRVRSGGGRTAIAQAAEDSADFAQVLREVEAEFRDAQRVFESTRTPMERYSAEVRKLDGFLASGMISQETYSRAMVAAMEDLDSATASTAQVTDRAAEAAEQLGLSFSSALEDAIVAGKGLREILDGLLQDILRITVRMTVTQPLAAGLTSLIGNITGSLFGGPGALMAPAGQSNPAAQMSAIRGAFADGGWVRGSGTGTSDSILARLSAGEFVVDARTAAANRGLLENLPKFAAGGFVGRAPAGGGGGSLQVVLENKSGQPLKLESQRQERGPDGRAIVRVLVVDAVKDALRGGELDGSMRTRYGAAVQPIGR